MDPWRDAFNHPNVSNREENEQYFNSILHNDPNLQVPVGNEASFSFSSFGSSWESFGSINQFLSPGDRGGSIPSASQNFAAPEMARLASKNSLDYAWSMGSGSPFQDAFQPPSLEPSPLILPQSGNNMIFPELDLTGASAVQNNSFEEKTSPLSANSDGSSIWNNAAPFSANLEMLNADLSYFNSMPPQALNGFFASDMFLNSLKNTTPETSPQTSPMLQPHDSSGPRTVINIPELGLADSDVKLSPTNNTSDLGIIHVGMNRTTGTMGPQKNPAGPGRRAVGRRGPLDPATRRKAAAMRGHACESCRKRKASCDAGIPCRSCVRYYGVRLLQSPCRGKLLHSLAEGFLKGPIFPKLRNLQSFLGQAYIFYDKEYSVKLKFGFGESVAFPMKIVKPFDATAKLVHNHIVYQWPPQANEVTARCSCQHFVFPAVIANEGNLKSVLDGHLGTLVDNHFDEFPAYDSVLKVLRPIYAFYRKLPEGEDPHHLLRQALKLLTLIHIGGDTQVCPRDPTARLVATKFFGRSAMGTRPNFPTCPSNLSALPTPCFVRGQLGGVMPSLAQDLMKDVLARLEVMSLSRDCNSWANACSAMAILIMAIESIEYHTRKVAFHAEPAQPTAETPKIFGPPAPAAASTPSGMEQGLHHLIAFYKSCFSGCHVRLSDESIGRQRSGSGGANALTTGQRDAQESLVAELKGVLAGAQTYLFEKRRASCKTGEDLSCFFDRSLAKLFLLN